MHAKSGVLFAKRELIIFACAAVRNATRWMRVILFHQIFFCLFTQSRAARCYRVRIVSVMQYSFYQCNWIWTTRSISTSRQISLTYIVWIFLSIYDAFLKTSSYCAGIYCFCTWHNSINNILFSFYKIYNMSNQNWPKTKYIIGGLAPLEPP